jgi:protein SCO1/2
MKKTIKTAIVLLTVVMFMTSCGNNSNVKSNENATEELKSAMYQCPMKCEGEKMYEEKGTCPVCKMDLELVSENEHHHHEH